MNRTQLEKKVSNWKENTTHSVSINDGFTEWEFEISGKADSSISDIAKIIFKALKQTPTEGKCLIKYK